MPYKVALPGLAQPGLAQSSPSGNGGSFYPASHSSGGSGGQASPAAYPPPSPSGKTPQSGGKYSADHQSLSHEEVGIIHKEITQL